VITLLFYIIPITTYAYHYTRVFLFVRQHSVTMQRVCAAHARAAAQCVQTASGTSQKLRVGRMVAALVGVYVACWTPYYAHIVVMVRVCDERPADIPGVSRSYPGSNIALNG
jgi:hypothetical protein